MTSTQLRYVDSDGHILEPPSGMAEFAPAEYRDRIWHIEVDKSGKESIVYNGSRSPALGGSGTAGFTQEQKKPVFSGGIPYSQVRPAGGRADLRLKDMDSEGIDLSVLYPTGLLPLQGERDAEFGRVQARAYNDWCSEHLKAGNGRLFGSGALPPIH